MDFAVYLERLKDLGLENAEELAGDLKDLLLELADAYVKSTSTPFDDIAYAALKGALDDELEKHIDKIDGKEG